MPRIAGVVVSGDLFAATRYVEWNPVRAGLVGRCQDCPWSSAAAHLAGSDDRLVKVAPLGSMMKGWAGFLGHSAPEDLQSRLQRHERTGRPLGHQGFLARL
jgi:putative transposase